MPVSLTVNVIELPLSVVPLHSPTNSAVSGPAGSSPAHPPSAPTSRARIGTSLRIANSLAICDRSDGSGVRDGDSWSGTGDVAGGELVAQAPGDAEDPLRDRVRAQVDAENLYDLARFEAAHESEL